MSRCAWASICWIPSNLVRAIGHNYVPAVVIFAIVYGLAIHKIYERRALLDVLNAVQVASHAALGGPLRPDRVCSIAGSVEPAHLAGLLLYVGLFLVGTLTLAFVVLPSVMAAVAPVGHREIPESIAACAEDFRA